MSDSDKEVEILEAVEKLINPPSSVDDLLSLLDKVFLCLSHVKQLPLYSMRKALSPLMKALVSGKLFKHSDGDVKVAVAACISEIIRITAPEAPYNDEQMKEVFKLIVSSFENLVDKSIRSYSKRTSILETTAKIRSCVLMVDLECDALLIEMFQNFLKVIRDHHSGNIFSSMENIMTLVLEESEDIPPEMLSPILHYVRKDDEVPQVSRRLAEHVLSNCASKLKTYLAEAVKSSGVSLDKYSNIVASICEGTFCPPQQDQIANEKEDSQGCLTKQTEVEKAADISTPEQIDAPKDESGKSGVSNGVAPQNESLIDPESTKEQDDTNAKDEPQQLDNPSNTDLDDTHDDNPDVENQIKEKENESSSVKQVWIHRKHQISKRRLPGSLLDRKDLLSSTPDSSFNVAISSENEKKTSELVLPSKTSADETANVSSPSRAEDVHEETPPKKTANQKKKESSTKEAKLSVASDTEEVSEKPNASEAKVTQKFGKKVASSSRAKSKVPPSKKSASETKARNQSEKKAVESDNVQESSKSKEDKKKTELGKTMDEESLHTSSGDNEKPTSSSGKSVLKSKKEVKPPVEESPNTNTKRKRSVDKEKASDLKNFGENLVGSRVKVWWPMDRAYYKGVVNSYDSAKKSHLVCYDDGDQENLNLKKQMWYFQHEFESSEDEEAADPTGHDEEASTTITTNTENQTLRNGVLAEIPTHVIEKVIKVEKDRDIEGHIDFGKFLNPPSYTNEAFKPERFYGYDFQTWKKRMLLFLSLSQMEQFIRDDGPTMPYGSSDIDTLTSVNNWVQTDLICKGLILGCLSDPLHKVYYGYPTSKELWNALNNEYNSEDTRGQKIARLLDFKMVDSKPIIGQIETLQILYQETANDGVVINEKFLANLIIEKLPPSWITIKQSLQHKQMSLLEVIMVLQIESKNRGA